MVTENVLAPDVVSSLPWPQDKGGEWDLGQLSEINDSIAGALSVDATVFSGDDLPGISFEVLKEKMSHPEVKKKLVDAIASNVICAILACPQEMLIGGLDITQFTRGRIMNVVPNALSGGVYGMWRDFVLNKIPEKWNDNQLKKFMVDSLVSMGYSTIYLPVYVMILKLAGAEWEGSLKTGITDILTSALTGRAFGFGMDKIRGIFGVETETSEEIDAIVDEVLNERVEKEDSEKSGE